MKHNDLPLQELPAHAHAWMTVAAGHAPRGEVLAHPASAPARGCLFVRQLRLEARIGCYDWEKASPQPLRLDLEFEAPSLLACRTDRLGDTVDYAAVVERLRELALARHFELVEALAEAMALLVEREFGAPWLRLSLTKLAPIPGAEVGMVLERGRRA
ncbi:MAG TPA: dihydroneopterin aldolase [Candidatus Desulfobacillus sp.]|nr:dihydroneopterin aldolase [Candidatus Desulfobacillus sp.]